MKGKKNMFLELDKYTFYTTKNKVIAISTYAGKVVRGIAKCDPRDEFDLEQGKRLAAARCNERIAGKRLRRARKCYNEATEDFRVAKARFEKMARYLEDSAIAAKEATALEVAIREELE